MKPMATDETKVAERIVSILPAGSVVRQCVEDRRTIRYAVRKAAAKLQAIVLSRASLRRLLHDPQLDVKIEYLQRELLRSLTRKVEFRYPHGAPGHPTAEPAAIAIGR